MHELLEYEASILLDIHQDSSLLVLAEGMGMDTILFSTMKLHSDPHNLVLVSNFRLPEARFLTELLAKDGVLHPPNIITADVNTKDREGMYKRGGVVFVTSRILVVDLLMERMPSSLVSGMIILRAHELQESCQENFVIRLLKERNPSVFIKAMTDNAISLTSGYNHAEHIMTQAGIPRLVLWPRFNLQVISCLTDTQPKVEEIRVPLTEAMTTCQACVLDLIKACIKELVDTNPALNTDELSLENALLPNFDRLVGMYLDPMWNQLSSGSRRLMGDVASLRRLLRILIEGDAVTFLQTLEGHRQAALASLGIPGPGGSDQSGGRRSGGACPSWFLMDQADRLLGAARSRVYKNFSRGLLKVELNPKWRAIRELLHDIASPEGKLVEHRQTVLILVGSQQSANTLERFLSRGPRSIKRFMTRRSMSAHEGPMAKPSNSTAPNVIKSTEPPKLCKQGKEKEPNPVTSWSSSDGESSSSSDPDQILLPTSNLNTPKLTSPELLPHGCFRISLAPRILPASANRWLEVILRIPPTRADEEAIGATTTAQPESSGDPQQSLRSPLLSYALDALQPRHVILYEPRVDWVRELEVHMARRHTRTADGEGVDEAAEEVTNSTTAQEVKPLSVLFMLYENSVEEQRYLTQLRREKEAFESLIQLSSRIVIRKDAFLPVSGLLSDGTQQQVPLVIVDMREFRSELPALLHRKGLKVEPKTLTIADYILAPHLCVERKSVSDLIGSINSGRLYQQCTAMSRHYPNPVLLIEFSLPTKITGNTLMRGGLGYRGDGAIGFSLYTGRHSVSAGTELNAHHLLSKIVLLTIHFPNLRFIWSVTPYCTAELFVELKQGRTEPSVERLPQDGEHLDDHNVEAVDMLLKLPGISWKNYRRVIDQVNSLEELSQCDLERLVDILDSRDCATRLYRFFHTACEVAPRSTGSATTSKDEAAGVKRPNPSGPRLALAGRVRTRRGRGRRPQ